MKQTKLILWALLLFAGLACEKEEFDIEDPVTDNKVNVWIEQTMRDHYLWYNEMPTKESLDLQADPQTLFASLLSPKDGKEREEGHIYFSQLMQVNTTKSINDTDDSYGFDFAQTRIQTGNNYENAAIVIYTHKDSPAEEAGIQRGDWILGINGSLGTIQDFDQLRKGGAVTLQIGKQEGNQIKHSHDVKLPASRPVQDTPFLKNTTYTIGGRRIAYLMYNHFSVGPDEYDTTDDTYNQEMLQIFKQFKNQQVQDCILDLRYNGGGNLDCAQLLASLLVDRSALGQPFCFIEYNDKQTKNNYTVPLMSSRKVIDNNLNLRRLYVLTGSTTASASELIINSLRPYIDVRTIGLTTIGKTVGMTIYNESEELGWVLAPVTFHTYNKLHAANYENGIQPDVEINEFNDPLQPLGDPLDPLIVQALKEITGQALLSRGGPSVNNLDISIQHTPKGLLHSNLFIFSNSK